MNHGQNLGPGFRVRIHGQDSGSGFWAMIQGQDSGSRFMVRIQGDNQKIDCKELLGASQMCLL